MDSTKHCPDDTNLAAWMDGRATAAEREALLAHVQQCSRCSDLVADVLASARNRPPRVRPIEMGWRWAAAAALLVALTGGFFAWLRSDRGETLYLRALTELLGPSVHSEVALSFHPPSTVPTAGLPIPRILRGHGEDAAPCAPGTSCGKALEQVQRRSGSRVRLLLDPEAAQLYLASAALDPGLAWKAAATIADHDWTHAEDPRLRIAAWLVLTLSGPFDRDALANVVRALDPVAIEDLPTLYNFAQLADLVDDRTRACAAWRSYLARAPTSPWLTEARRRAELCDTR